jgi:hypothetical protein
MLPGMDPYFMSNVSKAVWSTEAMVKLSYIGFLVYEEDDKMLK